MRRTRDAVWLASRLSLRFVVAQAQEISVNHPEDVVYVMAVPCPGCKRHNAGYVVAIQSELKQLDLQTKYVVCKVCNGIVISNIMRRH